MHGVATQNSGYGDQFKSKIKNILLRENIQLPVFYSSFWGHAFKNKTDQLFNWVKSDIREISNQCKELRGREGDIYRYQEHREDFIAKFFGDFLNYLNPEKGLAIRHQISNQFQDFVNAHPDEKEVIFIAHSLGTLILWDLLFAQDLSDDDPGYGLRKKFGHGDSELKLCGVVTMGSPLLFMRLRQDVNFSLIDNFDENYGNLTWINIIHASDLIAYPLGNAIQHDKVKNLFFSDQYLWMNANPAESGALKFGQAHAGMALGLADAHGSYWNDDVVVKLVAHLVKEDLVPLATQQVHTGWRSYSKDKNEPTDNKS